MAVNPRITTTSDPAMAAVIPPGGTVTPSVNAVVLVDGSGNILSSTDIGGGLATLDITGGGGGGGGGGDASAANQVLEIAQLTAINAGVPTALGQGAMAASMSVAIASDQSAVPVSGTVAVTGGATAANQATEIASLASIDAGTPAALGQTTMAASQPVVLASDQTAVPVSGTVAVTGVSTAANQVTANASLASIDGGTPAALGQTTMAASMPVALASDQSAVPVSGTVAVTGVSTAANQATEIASLASIDAGTPAALGQATMAASMPVVLASNQSTLAMAGDVASDGVDSGNPVKVGALARTSLPTAVANADRVNLIADQFGRLVTINSIPELNGDQFTTITASTAETTIITADAANKNHLHCLILSNSGVATEVSIRDVAAGTVRMAFYLPAGDTRGFAMSESASFKQATVNTAWTAQCSVSSSSVRITAKFIKATS